VMSFVIGRGSRAVAVGLLLGCLGAMGTTRVLTRMLYEIQPLDVPTFAGVAVTLTVFALVGNYIPARRATKVDPMESVRSD
jgi:putative ABC transport system permease protein